MAGPAQARAARRGAGSGDVRSGRPASSGIEAPRGARDDGFGDALVESRSEGRHLTIDGRLASAPPAGLLAPSTSAALRDAPSNGSMAPSREVIAPFVERHDVRDGGRVDGSSVVEAALECFAPPLGVAEQGLGARDGSGAAEGGMAGTARHVAGTFAGPSLPAVGSWNGATGLPAADTVASSRPGRVEVAPYARTSEAWS